VLTGRVRGMPMVPGAYRATVVARRGAAVQSAARRIDFVIARR
jgi:hypothetical protein